MSFFRKVDKKSYSHDTEPNTSLKYFIVGVFGVLGFAPFNLYPAFIASFSWFLSHLFEQRIISLKNAFFFFFGLYVFDLYWLAFPLTVDISKHFILIPFAITLIPGYFAAQLLIPVFMMRYFHGLTIKILIFPTIYTLTMFIQGYGMFGFPWVFPAYIWNTHELFLQTLSIYGTHGLNFVTILISSLIGAAIISYKQNKNISALKYSLSATFIFLTMCIFGVIRLANNPTEYTSHKIRIVQPNIKHDEKKQRVEMMNRLQDLSRNSENAEHSENSKSSGNIELLIWPEASVPYLYRDNLTGLNKLLAEPLENNGSYLIAGAIREDQNTGNIYNSAVFIDFFGRNIHNYDKIHLVPFGEYVPFRSILPFQSIANDIGDFNIGHSHELFDFDACKLDNLKLDGLKLNNFKLNSLKSDSLKIATLICYEAIFSDEYQFIAKNADVIINLTNDGWFGCTSEPFQHLQIVRAKAIELGIPIIRAANVGISAVFDPLGRIICHLPMDTMGRMDVYLPKKYLPKKQ